MEELTQLMLTPERGQAAEAWEPIHARTKRDLIKLLTERPRIAAQLRENCKVISLHSMHQSPTEIYSNFIGYLSDKYAYRRVLVKADQRSVEIAHSRVRLLGDPIARNVDDSSGRLILFLHLGRYLEVIISVFAQGGVVFAKRMSGDPKYLALLNFFERQFGTKSTVRFAEVLDCLSAGNTVLFAPDSANFAKPERNNIYNIGTLRVRFDSAIDALITRSHCRVSYLRIDDAGSEVHEVTCHDVHLENRLSGFQSMLGEFASQDVLKRPWQWDRLKYLHRIIDSGDGDL